MSNRKHKQYREQNSREQMLAKAQDRASAHADESSLERDPIIPELISAEQQVKAKSTRPATVMLAGLLVAAAAFGTTLFTWVDAHIAGAFGRQSVAVAGSQAAPAVSALAMVALAAPLAARIAPRILSYIVCTIAAAAGAGIVLTAVSVAVDPASAVVTETSRLTGTVAPAGSYTLSGWPWAAAACGALITLAAAWTAIASRSWSASRKYERTVEPHHTNSKEIDEMDAWDSLSRGEDPTDT